MICTLTGAQHLGSDSLCLTGLCAAAHPHTVGNIIIGTPRLCQGLSAFVIDDIPFSLFLLFHYHTIHSHMHTRNTVTHTHTQTLGVGPTASVRSSLWLHCVLMYLRILFCCSIVWVEIEAHHWERKVTEHISTKSPISRSLSVCECVCSLSLSVYLATSFPPSHTQPHIHARSISAAVCRSYSFTLRAISRQLLECPDLKHAEIATIVVLTTKYQASESGLSDSELLFIRVWGVQRADQIGR